jgi:hypothetical protein
MWTFLVELAAVEEQEAGNLYPETLFSGEMPDEAAMEKKLEADNALMIMPMIMKTKLDEDEFGHGGDDSFEDFGSLKLELE